jgi:hypothetical protein
MVDLHRPMRANQMPALRFGKVAPQIVMLLLPQITIALENSLTRLRRRNPFGRF